MGVYVFDNAWQMERERLAGLEATFDPGTIRHLEAIGVAEGWRCLEIGGGGGSIAEWLGSRVGSRGSVLATDVNTRFLDALSLPNLEVRKHDILVDELPADSFDLIHTRLLLEHLPERDQAMKRIVTALRPGGWLLIEDFDATRMLANPPGIFRYPWDGAAKRSVKIIRSLFKVMQSAGFDPEYGARLPSVLVEHGLIDIGAEMRSVLSWGGSRGTLMPAWTLEQLRGLLEQAGVSAKDLDREIASFGDPNIATFSPLIVSAWGRRPDADVPDHRRFDARRTSHRVRPRLAALSAAARGLHAGRALASGVARPPRGRAGR